jgi:hypothetical protein
VDEVAGFDTVLNTIERNTILLDEPAEISDSTQWGLKVPNIFVATFEIKGVGSSFNFRNNSNGDADVGYTLDFDGTTLTLKYDNASLTTATIPNLDAAYGKVYLTYEKQYFTVTVDGTRVLTYKDDVTRTPPEGEYANFFTGDGGGFKNLKVVAGHLISDGTSNVSLYGGLAVTSNLEVGQANLFVDTLNTRVGVGTTEPDASLHVTGNAYITSNLEVGQANLFVDTLNTRVGVGTTEPKESLDIVGNMHLTRVSNVSQIKVDSNVVAEYTGPHDRPLRKYPEVAMTSASQDGYVVTASSEYTTGNKLGVFTYYAWKLFDEISGGFVSGETWINGSFSAYDSNGDYVLSPANNLGTGADDGEWVKLELPVKIRLERIRLISRDESRAPKEIKIYGSNDNVNWVEILSDTNSGEVQTFGIPYTDSVYIGAYKYLGLVIKKVIGTGGYFAIDDLEYYGREEGSGSIDTTLKTVYNVPATTGTQLEVYYDAKDLTTMPSTVTDLSPNSNGGSVAGATLDTTDGIESFKFIASSSQYIEKVFSGYTQSAEYSASMWFKSDSYTTDSYIFQLGLGDHGDGSGFGMNIESEGPLRAYIYGYGSSSQVSTSVDSIATGTWYHATATYYSSGKIELYLNGVLVGEGKATQLGTINASAPLTLGTFWSSSQRNTPSFNGSIANFRLYSKALNAGQIKELYDYQKDYFLGSKSQVTLYKGHLGVGVTEPSGQLELAGDERIQEYPPRGFGVVAEDPDYSTYIEGHGVFTAYGSSQNNTGKSYSVIGAFDKTVSPDSSCWLSKAGTYSAGNPVSATAATINGIQGEFIALKSPYPIKLKSFTTQVRGGATSENSRMAKSGIIWGSNDGSTWYHVHSWSGRVYSDGNPNYFEVNSTKYYSHHALQTTETQGNVDATVIGELKFFGTPGPTTLDKGSLTLGRSLDVPRISRYDVDTETPRPEKLVVDFDTTVNSSPTDISGRGNHGTFYGTSEHYSPADKAFNFDGGGSYMFVPQITGATIDNWVHSISVWVFAPSHGETIFHIGNTLGGQHENIGLETEATGKLRYYFWTNDVQTPTDSFPLNTWNHVVVTYDGGSVLTSRSVYINGVKQVINLVPGGTLAALDLQVANVGGYIGIQRGGGKPFYGKMSNFKIYNAVLEPSEIKKLYRLGRTGRSMVISDTAVGIGKVPEAQLDVRGTLRSDGLTVGGDIYATGNITGYSDRRAKSDIEKIENALEKIEQLNGYTFTMKGKRYTGLIAQEILPILPEAVTGSEETNYAVAYGNMMGLIVEAIKELKQKIG